MDSAFQISPAARPTASLVIVAVHVAAIAALASSGALREVTREAQAIQVLVIAPPARHVQPPPAVPLPKLKPPEIHLPAPPIDNLFTMRVEEPKQAPPPAPSVPQVVATAPQAAPTLEPPRADLAYLDNPAPAYPAVSKRSREQGRVMLRVHVDEKGGVDSIEVQASSGFTRLDEAALAAVKRWRFRPARLGDRAVAGFALVPINFHLRG